MRVLDADRRREALIRFDFEGSTTTPNNAARGCMGPGLTETLGTPDDLADAGIEQVAVAPMDDRPFDIRTKRGTLAFIPDRVELNDIPMLLIQHHKAAQ